MKKLLFLFLSLYSVALFAQPNEATQLGTSTVIKNNPLTPAKVGAALDAVIYGKMDKLGTYVATGTNTYSTTYSAGTSAYTFGLEVNIKFGNTNTAASTLNLGYGAIPIVKGLSTPLVAGDIIQNVIYKLFYDGTNFQLKISGASNYAGNSPSTITVNDLPAGSTLTGISYDELMGHIFAPYINPSFTSFTYTGYLAVVPVGTTLSGAKTYTWNIALGSGVVSTIDIFDNTASSTLLAATPNDGTQSQTITTIQLNADNATQSWKGIGNNSSPSGTFNSGNLITIAHFPYYAGHSSATVTNSATVIALPVTGFATSGTFNFTTGTTDVTFTVALPPGKTLDMIFDNTTNADITTSFHSNSNINVLDVGSTNRVYSIKELIIGSAYGSSHTFTVTYH